MATVTIRAYGDLNDFVSNSRRQREFEHELPNPTTVKDLIEGVGIPHTEIALLLIDDAPARFHVLIDGPCRITAYPRFSRLSTPSGMRLQPDLPEPARFVLDVHLGTLARYLRLLGFGARYDNSADDDQLIDRSLSDGSILLTRDRRLLMRRALELGYFVRASNPLYQAREVVRRLHLHQQLAPFTRCLACNGELESVDKDEIEDRLEPKTRRHFTVFWRCASCQRIYWRGSHYERLRALIEALTSN